MTLKKYMLLGVLFVSVLGTLSHFFYAWSNHNMLIGLVSPVSESTWEHMKLLFFPMMLYTVFLSWKLRDYTSLLPALIIGTLIGLLLIPTLFYTYSGILGFHVSAIDILIFYISVIFSFFIGYRLTSRQKLQSYQLPLIVLMLLLTVCFFLFTAVVPDLGLFQVPKL